MLRWLPRNRPVTLADVWAAISPAQLLVIAFAALIAVGTLGFRLLPGLYTSEPLGWVDALFTATSAVCVTGLVVVDTATYFTPFGQAWILLLMQAGGLGILTLTSLVMLTVKRRLSLRHADLVTGAGGAGEAVDIRQLLRVVLRTTFTIEGIGALLLYGTWLRTYGWEGALWPSIFHAVSAFCNAGFSIFAHSFMGEAAHPLALWTVMALAMLGGLGFLTVAEVSDYARDRRRRLSLHARFVLVGTAVAIVVGTIVFAYFEWENTLAGMSNADRLWNALFTAMVARTAGFNTVDVGAVTAPSALLMMILMFVGGAPASTAGGIKVTTAGVLVALMLSRLRGDERVSAWYRCVPDETIGRAVGLTLVASTVLITGLFLLIALESPGAAPAAAQGEFIHLAFEATSALGTTGLSMNTTPTLSDPSRLLLVALMFIGRVGLLSVGAAITLSGRKQKFRYAYEDVAIG